MVSLISSGCRGWSAWWCPQHKHKFVADQPLAPGRHIIRVKFDYAGAKATLLVDERPVGQIKVEQTIVVRCSLDETFDIGQDTGTPVLEEYNAKMPYQFSGLLHRFVLCSSRSKLSPDEQRRLQEQLAQAMAAVH